MVAPHRTLVAPIHFQIVDALEMDLSPSSIPALPYSLPSMKL